MLKPKNFLYLPGIIVLALAGCKTAGVMSETQKTAFNQPATAEAGPDAPGTAESQAGESAIITNETDHEGAKGVSTAETGKEGAADELALAANPEVIYLDKTSPRDQRRYVLMTNGNFYRYVNGTKCQISSDVTHFKLSGHKLDVAIVYFLKKNGTAQDLWILRKDISTSRPCPAADKGLLMADLMQSDTAEGGVRIGRYTVTPNASEAVNTRVVNMALGANKNLRGWDENYLTLNATGINEFLMNSCYGNANKAFKRYVAFGLAYNGQVLKVDGARPSFDSKFTTETYTSLQEFKTRNNVCASAQGSNTTYQCFADNTANQTSPRNRFFGEASTERLAKEKALAQCKRPVGPYNSCVIITCYKLY